MTAHLKVPVPRCPQASFLSALKQSLDSVKSAFSRESSGTFLEEERLPKRAQDNAPCSLCDCVEVS